MLISPSSLKTDLDRLEEIERTSLKLVVQALLDYSMTILKVFQEETDLVADIGEDVTREALDRLGMPRIDQRLFGKVDYKRASYFFHPDYAVRQALFVDSKAEKASGRATATLQTSQFSMTVRQMRAGRPVEEHGKIPTILVIGDVPFITTTVFVKYNYEDMQGLRLLQDITVAAVPNGLLQDRYNPTPQDTIWLAGRNSPRHREEFRVRLNFPRLKQKAKWRVQQIPMPPSGFRWDQ